MEGSAFLLVIEHFFVPLVRVVDASRLFAPTIRRISIAAGNGPPLRAYQLVLATFYRLVQLWALLVLRLLVLVLAVLFDFVPRISDLLIAAVSPFASFDAFYRPLMQRLVEDLRVLHFEDQDFVGVVLVRHVFLEYQLRR